MAFTAIFSVTVPVTVSATNGYFPIGYGTNSRAMGGTGIANPVDSLAPASNPAGVAFVGTRIDVGAEFFNPPRKVAAANGEFNFQTPNVGASNVREAKSGSNLFLIPAMGGAYKFNRKMSIGFAAIGAGANTRYNADENFFQLTGVPPNQPYGTLGVQLIQMQMLPTISYRLKPNHAIGLSLALGVQQFRAYGLGNFGTPGSEADFQFSSDDSNLTNRGNDYSYGAGIRLGWLSHFYKKKFSVGAFYASRVYMTRFKKYKGLFAEQGSFDIPETYGIGIAFRPRQSITVAADITRILYSDVKSIGNKHPTQSLGDVCTRPIDADPVNCQPGNTPVPSSRAFGADNGFGFGWKDQTVYKIGLRYQFNDKLTLRAGYNYAKSPIPDNQLLFNLLATAIVEQHYTAGASYALSKNSDVGFSWVYGVQNTQTCKAPKCKTMLTQDDDAFVAIKMKIYALGFSYSYHF
ncbi:MAG: porin [Gammaproteobacteria bacterium]|nr:porin [Gammaproteobacteria bacterium]